MVLHGGWMQLIDNMISLWIFEDNVEDPWRHAKYVVMYMSWGIAASVSFILFNLHSSVPSLGASGAIAGILGAYLVYFPRNRIRVLMFRFITYMPAVVVLGFWFVLQLFSQIGEIGNTSQNSGVAYM